MTFQLQSSVTGRARSGSLWLFDANGRDACFVMDLQPLDLVADQPVLVTMRDDTASAFCPMPLAIDRMLFIIYEDRVLSSEQTFQIRYIFS
jgi:hypothetical protein